MNAKRIKAYGAPSLTLIILLVLGGAIACGDAGQVLSASGAAAAGCSRPVLSPGTPTAFWEDFAAYRDRRLTVRLEIENTGAADAAFNVTLTGLAAGNGVAVLTPLPSLVAGQLDAAGNAGIDIQLGIPQGVASFWLASYLTASDSCDNQYQYPPWGQGAPGGDTIFPPDNYWNTPVDELPVDVNSAAYIQTIGAADNVHPDFGSGTWNGGPIGIPYIEITGDQPLVDVVFDYADESDPGPYPVPPDAPIEGGPASDGDRHVILLDRENHMLYELYYAWPDPDGSWSAGSGAIYDLSSNTLRPAGWTSADAAGLPIFPGLVRYDEVAAGSIDHALRFTAPQTRRAYVWPARHFASSLTGTQYPPMGQRFRLKADYDISGFSPENQVILTALKRYGLVLADNGSPMFISGAPDERWDNDDLHQLQQLTGADFEAVDTSSLVVDPDSGQVRQG